MEQQLNNQSYFCLKNLQLFNFFFFFFFPAQKKRKKKKKKKIYDDDTHIDLYFDYFDI